MATILYVTSWENRGNDPEFPFGFVYFNDDSRVGFAPTTDAALWIEEGPYWNKGSERHLALAKEYLEARGIEFPPVKGRCRCGYEAKSEQDLDEHIEATMELNDNVSHG